MGNPCKHGHVDGARHTPCPKCQAEYYSEQIDDLKDLNTSLRQDKKILLGVIKERDKTIQSLQEENERLEQATKPFPMLAGIPITQTTAELIFEMYTALYGNQQSLEEIKSRGGFGWDEVKHITDNFIKRFGRQRYELLIKDK